MRGVQPSSTRCEMLYARVPWGLLPLYKCTKGQKVRVYTEAGDRAAADGADYTLGPEGLAR